MWRDKGKKGLREAVEERNYYGALKSKWFLQTRGVTGAWVDERTGGRVNSVIETLCHNAKNWKTHEGQ